MAFCDEFPEFNESKAAEFCINILSSSVLSLILFDISKEYILLARAGADHVCIGACLDHDRF